MSNENQPNRTQLTDLPVAEQELTGQEMAQVQGGASNLNLSKSNIDRQLTCSRCGKVGVDKDPCCPPPDRIG